MSFIMRLVLLFFSTALLAGCSQKPGPVTVSSPMTGGDAHQHGGGEHAGHKAALAKLDLLTGDGLKAGDPATLRFTVPGTDGKPLKTFSLTHDAKVHLIVIRHGLDRFAHLHPDVDASSGVLTAGYTFPAGGTYHLFADYQEAGKSPTTATARVEVAGAAIAATELKPDTPGRLSGDGLTAQVSVDGLAPGAEATVRFEVLDGERPVTDLEPYMGAMGHLAVVSADATRYVHAHPAGDKTAKNVVTFGAVFPEAGLYKGWGQFKRGGTVRVVPFVVLVK